MLVVCPLDDTPGDACGVRLQLLPWPPQRDVQLPYRDCPEGLQRVINLARDGHGNLCKGERREIQKGAILND